MSLVETYSSSSSSSCLSCKIRLCLALLWLVSEKAWLAGFQNKLGFLGKDMEQQQQQTVLMWKGDILSSVHNTCVYYWSKYWYTIPGAWDQPTNSHRVLDGPIMWDSLAAIVYQAVIRANVENMWEDWNKSRIRPCWKDTGVRDAESLMYVNKIAPLCYCRSPMAGES